MGLGIRPTLPSKRLKYSKESSTPRQRIMKREPPSGARQIAKHGNKSPRQGLTALTGRIIPLCLICFLSAASYTQARGTGTRFLTADKFGGLQTERIGA